MTLRTTGRKSSLIALTTLALLVFAAIAPSALAQVSTSQIPGGDTVGTVTDTVKDTVTDTTSGGGSATAPVTDTVDKTTDTVTGTTGTTTDQVGTVVDDTGKAVDDTTDTNTYSDTKKTVDNTTSETGTSVNNTINDAGETGGTVTNPVLNAKNPQVKDVDGDGRISKKERNTTTAGGSKSKKAAYRGEFTGNRASRKATDQAKFASLAAAEKKSRNAAASTPAFAVAPPREGFMTQLAQAATEAAEKLAFPLGLALMVGAFLMLQGRIDRKDAKLVLAPIDSEQDLLSFQ